MKIAYFVHDLADPAVARRVRRLKAGGAQPIVLGFRRGPTAPRDVAGAPVVDLGLTRDARLGHRARAAMMAALNAGRWRGVLAGTEVVMARGLGMLVVAEAARRACKLSANLVYDATSVHPAMLSLRRRAEAMRVLERGLMRRASLLLVTSAAAMEDYFQTVQGVGTSLFIEAMLSEDKEPDDDSRRFVHALMHGASAGAGQPFGARLVA
ncbi:MAG: hypothetical protein ABW360_11275 [Phenylobacterium sp.]